MGFLDSFLGGRKPGRPPAAPKEVREIAGLQHGDTKALSGVSNAALGQIKQYAPQVQGQYNKLSNYLGSQLPDFKDLGQEALDRYRNKYAPLESSIIDEISAAGGTGRQEFERQRAQHGMLSQSRKLLDDYRDQGGARGMAGSLSSAQNNPMVRMLLGAQAGASGSNAAYGEFRRGEDIRRGMLPQIQAYYDTAANRAINVPSSIRQAQIGATSGAGTALANMAGASLPLFNASKEMGNSAAGNFMGDYEMQIRNHQMMEQFKQQKHARKMNMLKNGIGLATGFATGGLSGGLSALGAGGMGGGGMGGFGNMMGAFGSAMGAGGGTPLGMNGPGVGPYGSGGPGHAPNMGGGSSFFNEFRAFL